VELLGEREIVFDETTSGESEHQVAPGSPERIEVLGLNSTDPSAPRGWEDSHGVFDCFPPPRFSRLNERSPACLAQVFLSESPIQPSSSSGG